MMGWGDFLVADLDLVVYLYVEKEARIKRLKERERARFGDRIDSGHDMHENHKSFMEWASSYEDGDLAMRSRVSEEAWMKNLGCKIVRIEKEIPLEKEIEIVSRAMGTLL